MHSSHIQYFKFSDSYNSVGKTDECETCRDCRTTILVLLLKVSNLYAFLCGYYGSPNVQNQMCELCTFPKSSLICYR